MVYCSWYPVFRHESHLPFDGIPSFRSVATCFFPLLSVCVFCTHFVVFDEKQYLKICTLAVHRWVVVTQHLIGGWIVGSAFLFVVVIGLITELQTCCVCSSVAWSWTAWSRELRRRGDEKMRYLEVGYSYTSWEMLTRTKGRMVGEASPIRGKRH